MEIPIALVERRYREMSNEELLALHPKDLTPAARLCYVKELDTRGLPTDRALAVISDEIPFAVAQRRYREMSDEELLALHPKDLTPAARFCHIKELAVRGLPTNTASAEMSDDPALELLPTNLEGDSHRHVLYLRPFSVDKQIRYFAGTKNPIFLQTKTQFLLPFQKIGPVDEIDPPGKDVKSRLPWQILFFQLLARAQIVVIHAGSTESVLWEMEQVIRHEPFVTSFLLTPRRKRGLDYRAVTETIEFAAGLSLPKGFLTPDSVIYFKSRNQILRIERLPEDRRLTELHEFVGPLCRVLETIHPGVTAHCLEVADRKRRHRMWVAVGSLVTLLAFYVLKQC